MEYESWSRNSVSWLPEGENHIILPLLVLIQYQRVSDGRTDGHTTTSHASIAGSEKIETLMLSNCKILLSSTEAQGKQQN